LLDGWINRVTEKLVPEHVHALPEHARESFPHQVCSSRERFLGDVVRPDSDAGEGIGFLFSGISIDQSHIHSWLGCDPCPPADLFAEYLGS
jgi:hypothetical protein